eukprot:CAMPEP_0181328928 /NCGR_PEP_ID=MMETSP1101-20121128/23017_1 /TAXON_ID=46948 /ORGANISM="Rhodomonas abbreviata, Strain Caron Lab Isolate" /LENGTH=519 /DNA_ID=CAMNT_0023437929 /DNA_START=281 /DNA_END=1841 /DNA_ORIENTATION=+
MAMTNLEVGPCKATDSPKVVVLVGKKAAIAGGGLAKHVPSMDSSVLQTMLEEVKPGDNGASTSTWLPGTGGGPATRLVLAVLPDKVSRHNSPICSHSITSLIQKEAGGKGDVRVLAAIDEESAVGPVACAVAKAFPLFNGKSKAEGEDEEAERTIRTSFVKADGSEVTEELRLAGARAAMGGVRRAANIADTPPEEMTAEALVQQATDVAKALGVKATVIRGPELDAKGYGGIWGVGKAAESPPGLVILSYEPEGATDATETVCLVGKGIMYDTGGLSLKISGAMCGMKHDNGGAAGLLGAFEAAVSLKAEQRLHLLLCIAENAIGPKAMRNDDILKCYSGKTVEINNTDAEGRLVLADGVAHATKHLSPNLVVDMATLTGAQMISTGKKHAAILANQEDVELRAVRAGRHSGDLAHPLVYAPELFKDEFKSKVADMKNSVKDRMNAQSSCAGTFIEQHLAKDYTGGWLHVDMAGPSTADERGTGYGVGFILSLLKVKAFAEASRQYLVSRSIPDAIGH